MPYIETENKILTKVRGTSESNETGSRQAILQLMHEEPEQVRTIYRQEFNIFALMHDGKNFCLGYLHPKYKKALDEKITRILSWKVTGGYPIKHPEYKNLKARFGLNLHIEIVSNLNKEAA
jgi:hypothetical protein